jgi:hypothetical protein
MTRDHGSYRWIALTAATASLLHFGCAGAQLPMTRIASAEGAIRAAQENGAVQSPRAALHLHYAETQQAEADRLVRDGEPDRAAYVFRRAEADADVALAFAREATAEREARAAGEALQTSQTAAR